MSDAAPKSKRRTEKMTDPATTAAAAQPLDTEIAYCQIHPGVGIARVGNSPDEFFIGPESPGHMAHPADEKFKDSEGRIKRQAARFRIYGYNKDGLAVRELTAADAHIEWTVQLANKKASCDMFLGKYWDLQYSNSNLGGKHPRRNQEIQDEAQRAMLLDVGPEAQTVSGANQHSKPMTGTFGPLPYTMIDPKKPALLAGSRSGFINQALYPASQGGDWVEVNKLAKNVWKGYPGALEPVAESPQLEVKLGELRTDEHGRLLVLGGHGESRSAVPDNPIGFLNLDSDYANNDYWQDDVSDGRVHAEVTMKGGGKLELRGGDSWVIVTPPKYAPHAEVLTTVWDCAEYSASVRWPEKYPPSKKISFTKDIYPIIRRISEYQWFNQYANAQHGSGMVYDLMDPARFAMLHKKGDASAKAVRQHVFGRMRPPLQVMEKLTGKTLPDVLTDPLATKWASMDFMPQMNGDGGSVTPNTNENIAANASLGGIYNSFNALIPSQYEAMQRWSDDDFEDDWTGSAPVQPLINQIPVASQPRALDRAALEPCAGGSFFPGIEITYIVIREDGATEDGTLWSDLGRFDTSKLEPGDITKRMALPWQADFSECRYRWWPAQRPDDIVTEAQYEAVVKSYDKTLDGPLAQALGARQLWTRDMPQTTPAIDNEMITAWKDLGFVVPKTGPDEQIVYVETERAPYVGSNLRDAFYRLMNIDAYPEFLPQVRLMVDEFLKEGEINQTDPAVGTGFSPFEYSPEAFDARMMSIYNAYVTGNSTALQSALVDSTREKQIYSILQMAPFNQLDGTWIRGAAPPGTVDQVRNLLFTIYMDEMGDGLDHQNHANIYTDVLRGLNIYLYDIGTRDYANDPRFLDSAFTQPVFLLGIAQFTESYLPEILGMTLYLEWSSVALQGTVDVLNAFGIDPVYYRLHVAIDNAASGHGAIAKQAVELYLDQVRQSGGDVQSIWQRIWNGYVTFATLGSLGNDITTHFKQPSTISDQMIAMIKRKAQFGSMNHNTKTVGPNIINDMFSKPAAFLDALVDAGYIVAGDPDNSKILQLMTFTGPMFHVFTDDEQALWRSYILSLKSSDASLADETPLARDARERKELDRDMIEVIGILRQRQNGVPAHAVRLTGPDPDKPMTDVTQPISWWLNIPGKDDKQIAHAVMSALREPKNGWITPGNVARSPFLTNMAGGTSAMAKAFRDVLLNGKTYLQIFATWVVKDCPIDGVSYKLFNQQRSMKAKLTVGQPQAMIAPAPVEVPPEPAKPRRVFGMGTIH
jgi:hypothetical protein